MDEIRPEADALFDEGYGFLEQGEYPSAAARFRSALALAPAFLEAQVNLAWTLERTGDLPEAESWYRRALDQAPHCLEAQRNLGVLLVGQKRFQEAEALYRLGLGIHPEAPELWANLGALQLCQKRDAEAQASLSKCLELDETFAAARFNLGYLALRQGRFEEGWAAQESRAGFAYTDRFTFPRWRGEDPAGKSLLIAAEAGHGDMIQFCRYAAVLKAQGAARIGVLCHPPLKRLFRTLDGADQVFGLDEPLPLTGWDFWTLPLSLPFHCGTRLESIPAPIPYLRALPELVARWRSLLPAGGVRVGLVWRGNPAFESDGDRSLDLAVLAPLGAVEGVHFIGLQHGPEAVQAPWPMLHLGALIEDFADTAAILESLDLVLTVDTAAAHLAGALGKPCWVLLPEYRTDWRWLTERSDSPWYPVGMRLFRETEGGWPGLIPGIKRELEAFVQARLERAQ